MLSALLFPGQGSQRPGMLASLPDHPAVAATRDEAGAALGRDWREFDRAETLDRTDGAQLALTISGVATARALAAEGARVNVVAGHSVGAFSGAVAAGALTFGDALRLVALRGRMMQDGRPSGFGMVAILGLREPRVRTLVERARSAGDLYVANINADLQIVAAGADAALARVSELALEAGARKTERLEVATASHCPLLAPVAAALSDAMRSIALRTPRMMYVSARRARVLRDADAIGVDLAMNVTEPVLWRDAARLMGELGVRTLVEASPGSTLRDLTSEALPDARVIALDGMSFASAVRLINGAV